MSYHNNEYDFREVDQFFDLTKKRIKNDDSLFIFDENLSKNELKKLKIKSKNLSTKISFLLNDYNNLYKKVKYNLSEIDKVYLDNFYVIIIDLKTRIKELSDYSDQCYNLNVVNDLPVKVDNLSKDFRSLRKEYYQTLSKINELENEKVTAKTKVYKELLLKAKSILKDKSDSYSQLNSKLSAMIDSAKEFSSYVDNEELLNDLEKIREDNEPLFDDLNYFDEKLKNKSIETYDSVKQINDEINDMNKIIDEINQININDFIDKIASQEMVYQNLLILNNKYTSGNVGKLLKDCEKYFNRPMFMRQLKKYNLDDGQLDIVKRDIENDILDQIITEDNADFKRIIKRRCKEFRKNNSGFDENQIDDLIGNITFSGVDEELINECKSKVKNDVLQGNITINQVELKLRNYVNKKINEINQLEELNIIKSNPNVPSIKIYLTPEETNEIYNALEKEIISEYGIRGNVETRAVYLINQKIRENQSEARARLNTIKRDFSNLTQLNKKQQIKFVHQIEFYINNNEIKYYDISEDYIVRLSIDFINYGEIRLG